MNPHNDPLAVLEIDIRADLDRVENMMREVVGSDQRTIVEMARHLIDAGGKRLRPMLVLLGGFLGDPKDPRLVPCGAAIELTHLATLYHDDVIDETRVRRGVPTANVRFGNSMAILTGDFLLARASALAADLGSYVSRYLAETIAELCEGQIMETESAATATDLERSLDVERYLDVIGRKTASLLSASCHLGAWLGGAPEAALDAVSAYGRALGMAFQLSDDILDVAGTAEESGKEPGTDLREGVLTMPALETLNGAVSGAAELRAALEQDDIVSALSVLRGNGSVDRARTAVRAWQDRAIEALSGVEPGEGRRALERLVWFIGERTA